MVTSQTIRVLFVDDSDDDVALVERQLRRYGFAPIVEQVETAEAMARALDCDRWDLVLLDYTLPRFGADHALALLKERDLDLPAIIVSGVVLEEAAVDALRAGAADFVRKDKLARLGPAIERELQEAENRRQRRRAEDERMRLLGELEAERNWLRAVLEDSPVGIIRVEDPRGQRIVANRRAEELFGKTLPPERGIAQYVGQIYRTDGSAQRLEDLVVSRVLQGEKVPPEEEIIRRPDGSEVRVLASAVPIRLGGAVTGAVVAYEDVTRQRELERLRDEWNSIVAHDLRQPIAIIFSQVGVLRRCCGTTMGDLGRTGLELLLTAAHSMDRMVGDLLDSSRIDARRLQLKPATFDLVVLVRDVVDRLSAESPDRPIGVDLAVPSLPIVADPTRISQVIGNILSNALKYGDAGAEIVVKVVARADVVEVSVTNRGRGIAPDELPRLFTRFYRTKQARADAVEGLGLGLYISKGLIEAHGGHMWAESIPGETTTFSFTLPFSNELTTINHCVTHY